MNPFMERMRQRIARWARRGRPEPQAGSFMFADPDEIQDVARQMTRTKAELEHSVTALRGWARDLGRRLEPQNLSGERRDELRTLGETVGGLAHNLNNSLAAILAYAEMMLREEQTERARRRLTVMRDVALEASTTVRRLQEAVSPQPERASGPVKIPAVLAEAVDMTAPRWRDDAQRLVVAPAEVLCRVQLVQEEATRGPIARRGEQVPIGVLQPLRLPRLDGAPALRERCVRREPPAQRDDPRQRARQSLLGAALYFSRHRPV